VTAHNKPVGTINTLLRNKDKECGITLEVSVGTFPGRELAIVSPGKRREDERKTRRRQRREIDRENTENTERTDLAATVCDW
jgi:hypothetical protein